MISSFFRNRIRRGFTLLELLVVLVIISLLAASVQVVFKSPLQSIRVRHAIEQLSAADALLRHECRQYRREGTIEFDCDQQTMTLQSDNGIAPKSIAIRGLLAVHSPTGQHANWATKVDRWGRSETYSIQIGNPRKNKWILCAGISGQVMEDQSESEIQTLLDGLTPSDFAR